MISRLYVKVFGLVKLFVFHNKQTNNLKCVLSRCKIIADLFDLYDD